ncbi:MAG: RNA polymerase sigma factor [Acidobacteria bacterium]|nr:RNA polymerase sigma factor [Acidobacteriota bacterium]
MSVIAEEEGAAAVAGIASADWERLKGVIERAVTRVCPRRLTAHRDDIVQAALLRVLDVLGRGEHAGIRTSSYLWQVAYTVTVDELRRVARRREVSLEEGDVIAMPVRRVPDPERIAEGIEAGEAIRACLQALARPRRLAVALHLYGFAAAEASRTLGWDLKQVHNLTYRGLADLRRCLASKGVTP